MDMERLGSHPMTRPGHVYDKEYGVWDRVVEQPVDQGSDADPERSKLRKVLKVSGALGSLVLAATLSYGGAHMVNDYMGRKSAGVIKHLSVPDVKPGDLWNDLINDLPARIEKGF